jgi:hypothetical protein
MCQRDMSDKACKVSLEVSDAYGESSAVFASFLRDETNVAIWRRTASPNLLKYFGEIEKSSICEGVSRRTVSFSNGQETELLFNATLDRPGLDCFMDDIRSVLNAVMDSIPAPVRLGLERGYTPIPDFVLAEAGHSCNDPAIVLSEPLDVVRFYFQKEARRKVHLGLAKALPEFHQDWVQRECANQGKGFTCIVNYIGPTTQFILGSAYNSVFEEYMDLLHRHGQGRHYLGVAVNNVFPQDGSPNSQSFFTSVGLYDVLLFARNIMPDKTNPISYAPVACMHRAQLPDGDGKRLTLVVNGYTLRDA